MVTPAGVGVPESSEALDSDEQILSLDQGGGGGGGGNSKLQCRSGTVQARVDCI